MSKRKKLNRNIQALPSLNQVNFANYPSTPVEETFSNKAHLFGEVIEKGRSTKLISDLAEYSSSSSKKSNLYELSSLNDTDFESVNSGISEIKLITSLSTSPSWSDDNEGSKQVQDELEHMDRILRGIDPIPLHFDVDEYKQWMETFPSLSLFGQKVFGPYKIDKNYPRYDSSYNSEPKQEIAFLKTDEMRNLKQYKEEIKKAVIYNIYENLSARLNSQMLYPASASKTQKHSLGNDTLKTRSYLNNCLKDSPFTCIIQDSRSRRNSSNRRYNSLEDRVEVSPRFESLPLMFEGQGKSINLNCNNSHSLKTRKPRRSIVLPPIKNDRSSSNQMRSISATPTYSSLLSTKGIKLEKKNFNGKSRNIR